MFRLTRSRLDPAALRGPLELPDCGACVCFEGWVRNHHQGRDVLRLEYEAYEALARKEGERILQETRELFGVRALAAVHRVGMLEVGECAVWVGVASPHRSEAFLACSYAIDQIKLRLPIWKREYYADGQAEWMACAACAPAPPG